MCNVLGPSRWEVVAVVWVFWLLVGAVVVGMLLATIIGRRRRAERTVALLVNRGTVDDVRQADAALARRTGPLQRNQGGSAM